MGKLEDRLRLQEARALGVLSRLCVANFENAPLKVRQCVEENEKYKALHIGVSMKEFSQKSGMSLSVAGTVLRRLKKSGEVSDAWYGTCHVWVPTRMVRAQW